MLVNESRGIVDLVVNNNVEVLEERQKRVSFETRYHRRRGFRGWYARLYRDTRDGKIASFVLKLTACLSLCCHNSAGKERQMGRCVPSSSRVPIRPCR